MTSERPLRDVPGHHAVEGGELRIPGLLSDGAIGIDAGLTLTKIARAHGDAVVLSVHATPPPGEAPPAAGVAVGVTGARALHPAAVRALDVQEIEAAARGAAVLLRSARSAATEAFVLALVGTGTAFAAVRDGKATHLGGTALGGGSFAGIARRFDPSLDYPEMIARAERGDRRRVDTMVSDAYPDGIGRIGPELTAAHLGKSASGAPDIDDVLAGLLNLHGENIAQIAASRALVAQLPRVVLAGGFVHNNPALVASLETMIRRFGIEPALAPWPGFAGAVGAAVIAAEAQKPRMEVKE
jgi:pantothenate kinase